MEKQTDIKVTVSETLKRDIQDMIPTENGQKLSQKDFITRLLEKGMIVEKGRQPKKIYGPFPKEERVEEDTISAEEKYSLEKLKIEFQEKASEKSDNYKKALKTIEDCQAKIAHLEKGIIDSNNEEINKKIIDFEKKARNFVENDPIFLNLTAHHAKIFTEKATEEVSNILDNSGFKKTTKESLRNVDQKLDKIPEKEDLEELKKYVQEAVFFASSESSKINKKIERTHQLLILFMVLISLVLVFLESL